MGNRPGWVYRVALNLARNRWRRLSLERRKPPPSDPPPAWIDGCADPAVARALERLPVDQRAVVVLGTTWTGPSRTSPVPWTSAPGTVKSRLHRALQKLASMLEEPS